MGLTDKLKNLAKQAQETVVEHKDQIQDAVGAAGATVDRKTHGKHTDKISKMEEKASDAIDKFSAGAAKGCAGSRASGQQ